MATTFSYDSWLRAYRREARKDQRLYVQSKRKQENRRTVVGGCEDCKSPKGCKRCR